MKLGLVSETMSSPTVTNFPRPVEAELEVLAMRERNFRMTEFLSSAA